MLFGHEAVILSEVKCVLYFRCLSTSLANKRTKSIFKRNLPVYEELVLDNECAGALRDYELFGLMTSGSARWKKRLGTRMKMMIGKSPSRTG